MPLPGWSACVILFETKKEVADKVDHGKNKNQRYDLRRRAGFADVVRCDGVLGGIGQIAEGVKFGDQRGLSN